MADLDPTTDPATDPALDADPALDPEPAAKPIAKPRTAEPARDKEVYARARRLAAQMADAEKKKIARAMGLETYDQAAIDAKLAEIGKAREDSMGVHQRLEARLKDSETREAAQRAENQKLRVELNRSRRELQREQKRREDLQIENQVQTAAILAGVADPEYALKLFGDHVAAKGEEDALSKDPKSFFESLKTVAKYRYLFVDDTVNAGPSTIAQEADRAAQTPGAGAAAAPEARATSPIPPQGPPSPAPNGAKAAPDVMKMTPREFSQYSQSKYGVRPGA